MPKDPNENKQLSLENMEAIVREREKENKLLREQIELKETSAFLDETSGAHLEKLNALHAKAVRENDKEAQARASAQIQENKLAREAVEDAEHELKILQKQNKESGELALNRQATYDIQQQQLEVDKAKWDVQFKIGKISKERLRHELGLIKLQEKAQGQLRDIVEHTQSIVAASTGIGDQWKNTIVGKVMLTKGGMQEFGHSLLSSLQPANLLGSYMMKVQEATAAGVIAFSDATSSLNALTGAGGAYNAQIVEIAKNTRQIGVGWAGAAEAIGELHSSMTGFTDLSKSAQTEITKTAIGLSKLGISSSTTGKSIDDLMKGLGMTKQGALAVQEDMAKMAIALGIPPAQMAEGFASAMPQLASWGKEAPEIFKKVAGAAKKLGVQMETLLSFSSQFDTFDSAATAVGKLNSILGGDLLNSYEMMNASAEERNEMLLESIELSGKSWESMNRFEQMAVANAAGITDMNEAQKLFSGGLSAYREGLNVTAASQEELERRQKAAASVTEKLTMLMESFAIAIEPIVSLVTWVVNGLLSLGPVLPVITTMISVIYLLSKATLIWTAITKGAMLMFFTFGNAIYNLRTGISFLTKITKMQTIATWLQNVAQGALNLTTGAFRKISAGVVAVAGWIKGLSVVTWLQNAAQAALNLTTSAGTRIFKALTSWTWLQTAAKSALAFVSGVLGISLGVQSGGQAAVAGTAGPAAAGTVAMGTAAWYAAIPIAILAVGIGLLALGIGLIAIAIAAVVWAFVYLIKLFMEAPMAALQAAGALAVMGVALGILSIGLAMVTIVALPAASALIVLGAASLIAGIGFTALGVGLGMIAFAVMALTDFIKLIIEAPTAVMKMVGAMSSLALSFVGFSISLMGMALVLPLIPLVAAGIFAIGLAMRTIPESKTITFATAMSGLAEVATVTPATVEGVKGVVEQAAAYLDIQAGFKAPDADAFVQALTKASEIQSQKQKSGGKGGGKDIVLVLNDREFGRAINVQLNSKHNVATR